MNLHCFWTFFCVYQTPFSTLPSLFCLSRKSRPPQRGGWAERKWWVWLRKPLPSFIFIAAAVTTEVVFITSIAHSPPRAGRSVPPFVSGKRFIRRPRCSCQSSDLLSLQRSPHQTSEEFLYFPQIFQWLLPDDHDAEVFRQWGFLVRACCDI